MLPSLERNDGVEADDLTERISAATPGINLGSRAMPIKVSLMSATVSMNRCRRLKNICSFHPMFTYARGAIVDWVKCGEGARAGKLKLMRPRHRCCIKRDQEQLK